MHSNLPYFASLVLLLLSSRSHAQDLSDLPSCAQSPALSAIGSTGCQASDFACLCKDNSFINAALAGAEKQCSQADLPKVIAFAQQICSSVGVSLTVSASADGSASVSPSTTNTQTPPTPSSATTTGTQGSQVVSPASSAAAATTVAMSQASETATSTSGASGRDARFGLRGMVWSGVVVGWWLFRIGA